MNCKPGDIAYITHPSLYGSLVSVLYHEPAGDYTLPDGHRALGYANYPTWVVESLGALFDAQTTKGTRKARYAAIGDQWLRPIRPGEGEDETLTWAPKREGQPA